MSGENADVAVEAADLKKRFGDFDAVKGVSFRIERGQCFGFLGPNGAGKTSTMRMVQAVSAPTSGHLRVLGLDPVVQGTTVRSRLGVVPQEDNLDPDLSVGENLHVYARYFRIASDVAKKRATELLDFVALGDRADRQIRELSGGMKRRLVIARALINEPELVVLDEPTTGLDPQARHLVWQKLRELRDRGVTMALTTHYMEEAERLCDTLVIMDGGKIIASGAPSELVAAHAGSEVVELRVTAALEAGVTDGLPLEGVVSERAGDVRLFFLPRHSELATALAERARRARVPCLIRNATLEDVFLRLTGRNLGGEVTTHSGFVENAFQVTARNLVVWRRVAVASAIGYVGEPLLYLVALGFGLGQVVPNLDGMSYAEFIAPGLVVSTVMYTATFECTFGAYTRLETQGTYDAILATPITLPELVAGEILFGGIKACFGGTVVLLVATAFGLVPSWTAICVVPVAFVAGLLFSSMALTVSGLSKSYEVFNYYFTLVIAPMYLFGGVFFPLSHMPRFVQAAAQIVPLTHVVELSRALVRGNVHWGLAIHFAAVLAFLIPAFFLSLKTMSKRVVK